MDLYIAVYFGIVNVWTTLASPQTCNHGLLCFKSEDDVMCKTQGLCWRITNELAAPTANGTAMAQLLAVELELSNVVVQGITEEVILELFLDNLKNTFGLKETDLLHMKMWNSTQDRCFIGPSKEYSGKFSFSRDVIVCQRWDTQTPHSHSNNDISKFPDTNFADAANYCRDPDDSGTPWCYTTSPHTRRQSCDGDECRDSGGNEYVVVTSVISPHIPRFSLVVGGIKGVLYEIGKFHAVGMALDVPFFWTYKIKWEGIKTVIRFQLNIEYNMLKVQSLSKTAKLLLQFFSETFQMDAREIYDLRFSDVAGDRINGTAMYIKKCSVIVFTSVGKLVSVASVLNTKVVLVLSFVSYQVQFKHGYLRSENPRRTAVEFSLPPATDNLAYILQDLETFVNKPCNDVCQQTNDQTIQNNCGNCVYVNTFRDKTYPLRNSFDSHTAEWKGNETRGLASDLIEPCAEHQEFCIGDYISKCAPLGRCEKYALNTILVDLAVYGDIKLFDIAGIDTVIDLVKEALVQIGRFCASSLHIEFYGQGRQSTGVRVIVQPFLNRKESIEALERYLATTSRVEYKTGFYVEIVKNSYSKQYLDIDKPEPRYVTNSCFGCKQNEVWCGLPDKSLCLQKDRCIEDAIAYPKFANDTDFVSVSILLTSDTKYLNITEDDKLELRYQICDILLCTLETVDNLRAVPLDLDSNTYEMVFDLINQNNLAELESFVFTLQVLADKRNLHFYIYDVSSAATWTSIPRSVEYRQLIYGFEKQQKHISESFGNAVVGASLSPLLILIFVLVIMLGRFLRTKLRKLNSEGKIVGSMEETTKRRPKVQAFFGRSNF